MDLLDAAVIDHLETRPLLNARRLATMMDSILDRRSEWIERRHRHVANLRKRATEGRSRARRRRDRQDHAVPDARPAATVLGSDPEMFRDNNGAYRRDLIRAVAQKVELLSPIEARIC